MENVMKTLIGVIGKIVGMTNGWKTVIGYVLLQIPWFAANPLLVEAIEKVISNPQDAMVWGNLVAQILLTLGELHRVFKNVKGTK